MVQRPAPLVQREGSNGPAESPMVRRPAPWFQEPAPIFRPGRHPWARFSLAQCLLHWVHFPSHKGHFFRRPIRQSSPGSSARLRSGGGEVPRSILAGLRRCNFPSPSAFCTGYIFPRTGPFFPTGPPGVRRPAPERGGRGPSFHPSRPQWGLFPHPEGAGC